MLIVHHLNNSRSQRVLFLLEELGVPYEIVRHERDKKTMLAPPALLAVHPLGKSPVIVDDGVTMAETGAIIEYILERYGNGRLEPKRGTPEHRRYTYWMHYAEGTLMPILVMKLVFNRIETSPMPFFVRPIAKGIAKKVKRLVIEPNLKRNVEFIEEELGRSAWLAGDEFTACDIQMSFPVEAAAARGGVDRSKPRILAYVERMKARPAYQRAMERGGPYTLSG
ncbi:MAG: glutathione S-transferase [Polyangia bacterium]